MLKYLYPRDPQSIKTHDLYLPLILSGTRNQGWPLWFVLHSKKCFLFWMLIKKVTKFWGQITLSDHFHPGRVCVLTLWARCFRVIPTSALFVPHAGVHSIPKVSNNSIGKYRKLLEKLSKWKKFLFESSKKFRKLRIQSARKAPKIRGGQG